MSHSQKRSTRIGIIHLLLRRGVMLDAVLYIAAVHKTSAVLSLNSVAAGQIAFG